jgi:hypothetical protein
MFQLYDGTHHELINPRNSKVSSRNLCYWRYDPKCKEMYNQEGGQIYKEIDNQEGGQIYNKIVGKILENG